MKFLLLFVGWRLQLHNSYDGEILAVYDRLKPRV